MDDESAHFDNIIASRYRAVLFNCTDAKGSIANVRRAKAAVVLAGGGSGTLNPGRHLLLRNPTPMTNLYTRCSTAWA